MSRSWPVKFPTATRCLGARGCDPPLPSQGTSSSRAAIRASLARPATRASPATPAKGRPATQAKGPRASLATPARGRRPDTDRVRPLEGEPNRCSVGIGDPAATAARARSRRSPSASGGRPFPRDRRVCLRGGG